MHKMLLFGIIPIVYYVYYNSIITYNLQILLRFKRYTYTSISVILTLIISFTNLTELEISTISIAGIIILICILNFIYYILYTINWDEFKYMLQILFEVFLFLGLGFFILNTIYPALFWTNKLTLLLMSPITIALISSTIYGAFKPTKLIVFYGFCEILGIFGTNVLIILCNQPNLSGIIFNLILFFLHIQHYHSYFYYIKISFYINVWNSNIIDTSITIFLWGSTFLVFCIIRYLLIIPLVLPVLLWLKICITKKSILFLLSLLILLSWLSYYKKFYEMTVCGFIILFNFAIIYFAILSGNDISTLINNFFVSSIPTVIEIPVTSLSHHENTLVSKDFTLFSLTEKELKQLYEKRKNCEMAIQQIQSSPELFQAYNFTNKQACHMLTIHIYEIDAYIVKNTKNCTDLAILGSEKWLARSNSSGNDKMNLLLNWVSTETWQRHYRLIAHDTAFRHTRLLKSWAPFPTEIIPFRQPRQKYPTLLFKIPLPPTFLTRMNAHTAALAEQNYLFKIPNSSTSLVTLDDTRKFKVEPFPEWEEWIRKKIGYVPSGSTRSVPNPRAKHDFDREAADRVSGATEMAEYCSRRVNQLRIIAVAAAGPLIRLWASSRQISTQTHIKYMKEYNQLQREHDAAVYSNWFWESAAELYTQIPTISLIEWGVLGGSIFISFIIGFVFLKNKYIMNKKWNRSITIIGLVIIIIIVMIELLSGSFLIILNWLNLEIICDNYIIFLDELKTQFDIFYTEYPNYKDHCYKLYRDVSLHKDAVKDLTGYIYADRAGIIQFSSEQFNIFFSNFINTGNQVLQDFDTGIIQAILDDKGRMDFLEKYYFYFSSFYELYSNDLILASLNYQYPK